jgi:nucleoside-diphosphate-sugar epimerase
MQPKSFLVSGGTGFIGSALVKRLVREGARVRIIDNDSRGARRRIAEVADDIEIIHADIRDTATVISAARGVDCIVHLAAVNGTEFFYSKPELVLDVGVRGMLAVIDAARANNVTHMVVASSSEVYQTPPCVPTDEHVPLSIPDITNPRYSYGGGKIATELMAMNYGRKGFSRMTVFRPHNVYGEDMGWEHVVPQFALRAKQAVEEQREGAIRFNIQGDGSQTRAFIHIDDFTDGLMHVIDKGEHLGIYHIGNPEEVTMAELARQIVSCFGRTAELIPNSAPEGATPRRCPDIRKLQKMGFAPRIGLADGLPSVVAWYANNRHLQLA